MSEHILIIKPSKGWAALNLRDLWHYRELLYFLTWRDIKVRYKQTLIGAAWAILQPFLTMIVFTVFFGKIAKLPSEGIPYPIFSYSGLLLWIYFSSAVSNSGNSLVGSSNLITKVYFPRLIIPLSSALAAIIDYFIALCILVLMMFFYGLFPNSLIVLLPFILLLAFISATGLGLWLSALNVKYRDVRYAIPFFIQLLLFATPVIYPATVLPEKFRWLLALNPISGIIDAHRACILGYKPVDWSSLGISTAVGLFIFITGLFYFRRTERFFADII
jgi:homopolymeric O-antigen transport system permease protein